MPSMHVCRLVLGVLVRFSQGAPMILPEASSPMRASRVLFAIVVALMASWLGFTSCAPRPPGPGGEPLIPPRAEPAGAESPAADQPHPGPASPSPQRPSD